MTHLATLFNIDLLASKHWFSRDRFSKLAVIFGFLTLASFLFAGIFFTSLALFYGLSGYGQFGLLTAEYLFKATLVVVFWLGLGSALLVTLRWLLKPSPETSHLITLPLSPHIFLYYQQLKAVVLTSVFLTIFLAPIYFAYHYTLTSFSFVSLFFPLVALVVTLALVCQLLATLISFISAKWIKNQGRIFLITSIIFITLVGTLFLVHQLFPSTLRQLYASQEDEFVSIYNSLPLNSGYSPTHYLTISLIHNKPSIVGLFVLISAGVFLLVNYFASKYLLTILQASQNHLSNSPRLLSTESLSYRAPLVSNLRLRFLRNTQEVGYGVFLLLLASSFFLLLSQAQVVRQFEAEWLDELFLFVLSWILFFGTAYSLRLIFPIGTHLRKQSWLLQSQPIPSQDIFKSYLWHGFSLCLPLLVISGLTWTLLPFPDGLRWLGVSLSLWSVMVITVLNLFLGIINATTDHRDDPSLVSTSGMGLVSLLLTLCYGIITIVTTNQLIQSQIEVFTLSAILGTSSLFVLLVLSAVSRSKLNKSAI